MRRCCGDCCCQTFTVVCEGVAVEGATVTIKSGGTTIASGTTDGSGKVKLCVLTGTYTVTATGGSCDFGFNGTLTLACGGTYELGCCNCTLTVCVTGCPDGTDLVGASVSVTPAGGGSTLSCTTGAGGCCTITTLPGGGDYTVVVSASGYITYTATQTIMCNQTLNVALQPSSAPATVEFQVFGCCGLALEGATVMIGGQTCTTDALGICDFWIGAGGTYPWSVSADRFVTATGSVDLGTCGATGTNMSVNLVQADGYVCGAACGAWPSPLTLTLSDSVYGGCTLTFDPVSGTYKGDAPGLTSQPVAGCPSETFTLHWTLQGHCAPQLSAAYSVVQCGGCEAGFFDGLGNRVPCDTPAPIPCTGTTDTIGCRGNVLGNCLLADTCEGSVVVCGDGEVTDITFTMPATAIGLTSCNAWPSGSTVVVTE